jgi:hypothetical protein
VVDPKERLPPDPAAGRPRGSLQTTGGPDAVQTSERSASPPRGRPFPKGVSGNPAGRPPGIRDRRTLRQALLERLGETDAKGLSFRQRVVEAIVNQAIRGNVQAFKEVRDTVDGRPIGSDQMRGQDSATRPGITLNVLNILKELPDETLERLEKAAALDAEGQELD